MYLYFTYSAICAKISHKEAGRMFGLMFIVMLAVFGGANYYIARRLYQGAVRLFPALKFWMLLAFFGVMFVIMAVGFFGSMSSGAMGGLWHVIDTVSSYWMGIFVYLLLFTACADVVALIVHFCRVSVATGTLFRFGSGLAIVAITLTTVLYGTIHASTVKHISYDIDIPKSVDISDLNIVMISDLHLGAVRSEKRLPEIVEEINSRSPDVVCIAGDFFNTDYSCIRNPEKAIETLKGIKSTYGVYVCLGNHDAGGTAQKMREFIDECGFNLLCDELAVIDGRLIIIGRLDSSPIGSFGGEKRMPTEALLAELDTSLPVIVLDHNPSHIDEYTGGIDLILSGHTHKGQIFPGSLITNALFTVDHGHFQKDSGSPHVIVTSGVGTWGLPMRVGTDSEIVSITIN